MTSTEAGPIYGNWRHRTYGRLTHLYRDRVPVCGHRVTYATTTKAGHVKLADLCYDCLAFAASGR